MNKLTKIGIAAVIACTALITQAQSVKEIVLEQISTTTTTSSTTASTGPRQDAAMIRFLVEGPGDRLEHRNPANSFFYTGERFKVLFTPNRDGKVSLYNTPPSGGVPVLLWQSPVRAKQEVVSPNLVLTGRKGLETLHILLEPLNERNPIIGWIQDVFLDFGAKSGKAKDIRLEYAQEATYAVSPVGTGVYQPVLINHR